MLQSQSYWYQRQLVVLLDGPEGQEKIVVDQPHACIGSNPLCEIVLPNKTISAKKYYLHAVPEGIFCLNLSANHDDPTTSFWLHHGKTLTIGEYKITAEHPDSLTQTEVPDFLMNQKGTVQAPYPELHFSGGGKELGTRRLNRRLTLVGRHPNCPLKLTSRSVSAFHCVLYWDNEDLWFVDLHSRSGCQLDGIRKSIGRFEHGSQLRHGRVTITFRMNEFVGGNHEKRRQSPAKPVVPSEWDLAPPPITEDTPDPVEDNDPLRFANLPRQQGSATDEEVKEADAEDALFQLNEMTADAEKTQHLERLKAMIGELQEKIRVRDTQREQLINAHEEEIESAKKELDETRSHFETELETLGQQLEQRDENRIEIQELHAQIAVHSGQAKQATQQLESLTGQIENERQQMADKIRSLEHELEELGRDRAKSSTELDAVQLQHRELIADIEQNRDELVARLNEEVAKNEKMQTTVDELMKAARTHDQRVKEKSLELETEKEKLADAIRSAAEERKQFESTLAKAEFEHADRVADYASQLEASEKLVDRQQVDLDKLKDAVNHLEMEASNLSDAREKLDARYVQLSREYQRLQQDHQRSKSDFETLQSQTPPSPEQLLDALQKQQEITENNRVALETTQASLAEVVHSLQMELRELRSQIQTSANG